MPAPARFEKAHWYLNRLRAMSLAEIGHRFVEHARRRTLRRQPPPRSPVTPDAEHWPHIDRLREGVAALAADPGFARLCRGAVAAFYEGPVLLGRRWPAQRPRPWLLDPVTGDSWHSGRFCFDVDYRHRADLGDVKYVWELNRLQYLQPVAAWAFATGDTRLAGDCAAEVDDWIEQLPAYTEVPWASGIEIALRAVSLLVVTTLLGSASFDATQRRRIGDTLQAHGLWLAQFPSRYSSANNHRIAEAGALYLLGVAAPFLADADRWREEGRAALEHEASLQLLPDGVGAEQSPTYTAFSLEWLLLCARVADGEGHPFSTALWQRLRMAAEHLCWITDQAGNTPRIGDDDEGRVLFSAPGEPYVARMAAALSSATSAAVGNPPGATGTSFRDVLLPRRAQPAAPSGAHSFPDGGYTVFRTQGPPPERLLVFDHGPLGYLAIAAHGHADALSVWLHIGDIPVLVDAGTYLYHSGGSWRDAFRGTRFHNTLCLDQVDSSLISGAFNWSHKARCRLVSLGTAAGDWHAEAEHDGYLRRYGIRHRRRIESSDGMLWRIEDRLIDARQAWPVTVNFLINPALSVTQNGARWSIAHEGTPIAALECPHPGAEIRLLHGASAPAAGWVSPAFGKLEPAPVLSISARLHAERLTTLLHAAPAEQDGEPVEAHGANPVCDGVSRPRTPSVTDQQSEHP